MSRATRRRVEKIKRKPSEVRLPSNLHAVFSQAVAHHKALQFTQAETRYQQILDQYPTHPDSLHLLGLTYLQRGDTNKAAQLISQAIASDPKKPHYHFNLGLACEKEGKFDDSVTAYRQAVHINPSYVEALNNLGNVYRIQGKLEQAVQAFESVLRIRPKSGEAHNNLGVIYKGKKRINEAIRQYRLALEINPSHAEAHNNLGVALKDEGKLDEAAHAFQQAITCKPTYSNAHYHLGLTLLWKKHLDEALRCFQRSAELTHNHGRPVHIQTTTSARIKHDLEQMLYLQRHDLVQELPGSYIETLQMIRGQIQSQRNHSGVIRLSIEDRRHLAPSFNSIRYHGVANVLSGGTLNPHLDVAAIEANYHAKQPELTFVDQLLNEEALTNLRRFCLEATIWKKDYHNGYLGAFLAEGFACPLLLQIAEELRLRFPGIFKHHRLAQAWAFKYDSELQGLNMHADAAAVNVNFWITPDDANLDPTNGGLVVWDKEAPDEWDFKTYNSDRNNQKIRDFLERYHAKAITVPHRQNRALMFNSNLFHETDTLNFKDEYESRRINVTLLYGYRQQAQTRIS